MWCCDSTSGLRNWPCRSDQEFTCPSFFIVALPFFGALLPGLMNSAGRSACAGVTFTVSLAAFIGLLTNLPTVLAGEVVMARVDWLPLLGLNFTLMLDGLGFFFALLILGIGLLIIAYARHYLSRDDNMGEFFTYLLLFQGAMVGIVLAITYCFCWFSGNLRRCRPSC